MSCQKDQDQTPYLEGALYHQECLGSEYFSPTDNPCTAIKEEPAMANYIYACDPT
ncbi:hypothetical protein EPUS_01487 [Endocarpon pusillum Z07020]|uniref:Uncharacterized protein n=1 Tax=Endocarpon pusillum (strain Z07020 / HMAS-L-300199) TaxID=1263415 RepID=U1GUM9_ENDPU|nr:uncharacterized protein EPUS_01487 [Endocarpon pusillum Z07020]ERF76153.1 hypothetical protein EPUS_01487 [Endocarpon pusillum Z07020]